MRKVTVLDSVTSELKSFEIDNNVSTYGQLLEKMVENDISTSNRKVVEKETRLTYENEGIALPNRDMTMFLLVNETKAGAKDPFEHYTSLKKVTSMIPSNVKRTLKRMVKSGHISSSEVDLTLSGNKLKPVLHSLAVKYSGGKTPVKTKVKKANKIAKKPVKKFNNPSENDTQVSSEVVEKKKPSFTPEGNNAIGLGIEGMYEVKRVDNSSNSSKKGLDLENVNLEEMEKNLINLLEICTSSLTLQKKILEKTEAFTRNMDNSAEKEEVDKLIDKLKKEAKIIEKGMKK